MNGSKSVLLVSSLVLAMGTVFAAGDAEAVTQTRRFAQNPTDVCQSALPVFDGQIRKRPKAVQNEGTSGAFITCSWTSQGNFGADASNPTSVTIWFAVNDGEADTVSCTGVNGYNTGTNRTFVRTAALAASGGQTSMTFLPADFAGTTTFPSGLFSVSCSLNPGVGINDSYVNFVEDVGT